MDDKEDQPYNRRRRKRTDLRWVRNSDEFATEETLGKDWRELSVHKLETEEKPKEKYEINIINSVTTLINKNTTEVIWHSWDQIVSSTLYYYESYKINYSLLM